MKRILTLTLAVFLLAATAMADIHGAWTADDDEEKAGRIHFNLSQRKFSNWGQTMRIADFTGLSEAQIRATTMTPVQFQLRREAGTVSFEGTFKNGDGAGQFEFAPNRDYPAAIRALGVEFNLKRHGRSKSEDEQLFSLAVFDVSTSFIRSMQAMGYKETLDKYVEMRIFNVTPEFIKEMQSIFGELSSQKLIDSRIHGVTPEYVRKMRAAGWDLKFHQYMDARIHGASPEFAEEMRKLGYGNLSFNKLLDFRIHGVKPAFIAELRELGYKDLSAQQLLNMRIHGVTVEFIRELEKAGYRNVPVDKMVTMKIHGIDAKYISKMNDKD